MRLLAHKGHLLWRLFLQHALGFEHSHHEKLAAELTVGVFESHLFGQFLCRTVGIQRSNQEPVQCLVGRVGMERGEDIGEIIPGVCEDDVSSGMLFFHQPKRAETNRTG